MKLRLQTDYALRALIFLGFVNRKSKAEEIATTFNVSKDHLVKVIQQLSRHGFVRTFSGRNGGIALASDASEIKVRDVIHAIEGRNGVLECVSDPDFCPMEPGCGLRRLLMQAEDAFYDTIGDTTIADLCSRRQRGGIVNLSIDRKG